MTVSIEYRLTGTGWSECLIRLNDQRVEITGSYLSDCLAGFAGAALQILDGAACARFSFDEEPGEYRGIIDRSGERLRLRIVEFPELWGDRPDEEGEVLLDERCVASDFVAAVRDALQCVLDEHGEDGYRERWVEHGFPMAQLLALRDRAK